MEQFALARYDVSLNNPTYLYLQFTDNVANAID